MSSHVPTANVGAERRVVFEQNDIKHLSFAERSLDAQGCACNIAA
jgi:hypothetical protein